MYDTRLLGLVLLTTSLAVVTASGGFSAAEADRNATIETVEDPEAFLGIQTHDIEKTATDEFDDIEADVDLDADEPGAGAAVLLVYEDVPIATLTNRFPAEIETIDVGVDTEDDYPIVEEAETPDPLPVGENGDVLVDIKCPVVLTTVGDEVVVSGLGPAETTATMDTTAVSPDARMEANLARDAHVECAFPGVTVDEDLLGEDLLEELGLEVGPETETDEVVDDTTDGVDETVDGVTDDTDDILDEDEDSDIGL